MAKDQEPIEKAPVVAEQFRRWPTSALCLPFMFFFLFAGTGAFQGYLKGYFTQVHRYSPYAAASIIAFVYLVFSVSRYFAGTIMHLVGRKRAIILGALGFFLFPVGVALLDTYVLFLVAAALWGIMASLLWTGGSTQVLDASLKDRLGRASGFLYSATSAGQVAGVITLGIIASLAVQGAYYWSLFSCAILFSGIGAALAVFIPKVQGAAKRPRLRHVIEFYKRPVNWVMPVVFCLASMPYGFVLSILNSAAKEIAPVWGVTIILAFYYATNSVTASISGRVSDKLGRVGTFAACLVIGGAVLSVIGLFDKTMPLLCFAAIVLSWPHGGLSPVVMAWVGDLSTPETRPTVHACAFSWRDLGVGLAALTGGGLQAIFPRIETVFLVFGLFFLFAGIATWGLSKALGGADGSKSAIE